jgi:HD-like signal output (HDOD) protein
MKPEAASVIALSNRESEPVQAAQPGAVNLMKDHALRSLNELPPFSPIAQLLIASLAGKDVSFAKLGELIEKDAVIAGNILHLVNSALYARRVPTTSVRHAISRLGINKMRNAVLGMSIAGMWGQAPPPRGWSMARFNKHSVFVAVLSDLLAQRLPLDYPEGAFIAGLLHDVGHLLITVTYPAVATRLLELSGEGEVPSLAREQELLDFTHPELSAAALEVWNLPDPIRTAVREHHDLPELRAPRSGRVPLGAVIQAADVYVNSLGDSIFANASSKTPDTTAMQALGLLPAQLEPLLEEFTAESGMMAHFFA